MARLVTSAAGPRPAPAARLGGLTSIGPRAVTLYAGRRFHEEFVSFVIKGKQRWLARRARVRHLEVRCAH